MEITDKQRLDFVQNNSCAVYERFALMEHRDKWVVEFKKSNQYFTAKTARQAIDKAIKEFEA